MVRCQFESPLPLANQWGNQGGNQWGNHWAVTHKKKITKKSSRMSIGFPLNGGQNGDEIKSSAPEAFLDVCVCVCVCVCDDYQRH